MACATSASTAPPANAWVKIAASASVPPMNTLPAAAAITPATLRSARLPEWRGDEARGASDLGSLAAPRSWRVHRLTITRLQTLDTSVPVCVTGRRKLIAAKVATPEVCAQGVPEIA